MYTRHFYKVDEVYSALTYATAFGRVREAVFWAQELLDSNLGLDCLKSLFHSWILFRGLGSFQWLDAALTVWKSGEIEDDQILLLAYQLASLPLSARDSTPLTLMYLTFGDKQPDRLLVSGCPVEDSRTSYDQAILRSVHQKKTEMLWLLLRKYFNTDHKVIWKYLVDATQGHASLQKILHDLEDLEGLLEDSTKTFFLYALGVGAVCLSSQSLKESLKPLRTELDPPTQKELAEWNELLGRKLRRIFEIPRDCLYWVTDRGQKLYTYSSVQELPDLLIDLEGSEYWSEALESKSFDDLTDLEKFAFLETYFPDGHPMTWTKEEISKSHGDGCLGPKEEPSLQRWQRIWIRNTESRVLWKGWERASKVHVSIHDDLVDLFAENKDTWETQLATWNLAPVKKIVVPAATT
jgi:hypothetical protein